MNMQELAQGFTQLCAAGQLDEAAERYWSDDVVSVEAFPGPMQVCKGRTAVLEKQATWKTHTTIQTVRCEGPFINGSQFSTIFELDCSNAEGEKQTLREVALYSVEDDKIIEERFFPLSTPQSS